MELFCGDCQPDRQTHTPHKHVPYIVSGRVLELLHLYLMGSMQSESLGGKRYMLVCIDDFSQFTWVHFLREKSDTFAIFQALVLQLQ